MSSTFEDLQVWQLSMNLVEAIYRGTQQWPAEERYGLVSQVRRAAISIPSNIAEGKGRASDKELIKFLNYSRGSVYEIQTQLKIAFRLNYLSATGASVLDNQAAEVGRVLNGLIRAIGTMETRAEDFERSAAGLARAQSLKPKA
jgi:four helix bundle protein